MVASSEAAEWVLLAYRIPREPSTPRIAVWRRLRRLGAAQLLDGLVALPLDSRNREQFDWLAAEIIEAGGAATLWIGRLASRREERALVATLRDGVKAEYTKLVQEAEELQEASPGVRRRALGRLRRELQRIRGRDYFANTERAHAEQAVEELAQIIEQGATVR